MYTESGKDTFWHPQSGFKRFHQLYSKDQLLKECFYEIGITSLQMSIFFRRTAIYGNSNKYLIEVLKLHPK